MLIDELLRGADVIADDGIAFAKYYPEKQTIICEIRSVLIKEEDFKKLFTAIGEKAKRTGTQKIIFDKRKLKVFDQNAMTWYHTVWKEDLLKTIGLKKHRKLLPLDDLFQKSVEVGRQKIAREYNFDFEKYDIVYCSSIEEALEK